MPSTVKTTSSRRARRRKAAGKVLSAARSMGSLAMPRCPTTITCTLHRALRERHASRDSGCDRHRQSARRIHRFRWLDKSRDLRRLFYHIHTHDESMNQYCDVGSNSYTQWTGGQAQIPIYSHEVIWYEIGSGNSDAAHLPGINFDIAQLSEAEKRPPQMSGSLSY